jgi:hypothetical protein
MAVMVRVGEAAEEWEERRVKSVAMDELNSCSRRVYDRGRGNARVTMPDGWRVSKRGVGAAVEGVKRPPSKGRHLRWSRSAGRNRPMSGRRRRPHRFRG